MYYNLLEFYLNFNINNSPRGIGGICDYFWEKNVLKKGDNLIMN